MFKNLVVFGSVNAKRRHYYRAAKVLAKADRSWLGQLIIAALAPNKSNRRWPGPLTTSKLSWNLQTNGFVRHAAIAHLSQLDGYARRVPAVIFAASPPDFKSIDAAVIIDAFLLLLIGIGPKIALVPFLEVTGGMDDATKKRVSRKMLVTAALVAVLLVLLGELLTRLLHFSPGALSVAGGIVLFIISLAMILGPGDPETRHRSMEGKDPMLLAVFPLAVPYLLNPAGIVALVTVSGDAGSVGLFGIVFGLLAVVLALDVAVFRWANKVSDHLDESRMLVTEKVFGFLLAALGVQLVLNGLSDVGVIHLAGH